ncbi:hypothetical protein FSP39_014190 [Pinctada imbricata]|uniref:DUF3752 domain-containing protein n=1 Tax=Pinctada imbricata TaxID=66713 RepID=A0AA89BYP5_PINIB|nr:hypothetical protein FSP39_014190 [Pinctada imbricata]
MEDSNVIGPSLPSHLSNRNNEYNVDSSSIGPNIPNYTSGSYNEESDSEEDYVGPRPSEMTHGDTDHITAAEFEARSRRMKDRIDGKTSGEDKSVKRESWMTVLPDCLGQNIGLQARSFRVQQGPDMSDRSAWTDTPADRERKLKEQSDGGRKRKHEESKKSSRDTKLAKEIEQYNKSKRSESLLDLHQKKLKSKQKEEEDKPAVRRPFDRETDLEVNKFDDAQRKSIIKKSQNLNSRFGHGKTQFL